MTSNLIKLKQEIVKENIFILQSIIRDLTADLKSGTKKSTGKVGLSKAIASCIRTQSSLLCDMTNSLEAKIYLKILTAGKLNQQKLLTEADDFDDSWDAISSLKSQGLIEVTGRGVKDKELSVCLSEV